MNITVAGASGFIGKNVIKKLLLKYNVNGLSRSKKKNTENLKWIQTDLFSFSSTQKALEGADVAIYLVHSMLPSSRLFQGNFQDTDLLLADNFAKSCIKNGVKQIIYLGGLVPDKGASKHLESRKEVEDVFKSTGIPVTIFRAGLVVGDGGSSFEILKNLVFNLPGMILPKWTKRNTQAIYIDDLVAVINDSISNKSYSNKTLNVVNGESITYAELIRNTADSIGAKILMISVPINYTSFSKLWVTIFGQANYELVSPLVDSLVCDLPTPKIPKEINHLIQYRSYEMMLTQISKKKSVKKQIRKEADVNNVRSIQRLPNPSGLTHEQLSISYISWLPKYLKFLVRAHKSGNNLKFFAFGIKEPLLVLDKVISDDCLGRTKFNIIGGLLSNTHHSGWLEFRIVSDGKYALASINEYIPSLPWYIYKITQAPLHAYVMGRFRAYLNSKV